MVLYPLFPHSLGHVQAPLARDSRFIRK